jgi:hypothetical protein
LRPPIVAERSADRFWKIRPRKTAVQEISREDSLRTGSEFRHDPDLPGIDLEERARRAPELASFNVPVGIHASGCLGPQICSPEGQETDSGENFVCGQFRPITDVSDEMLEMHLRVLASRIARP